MKHYYDMLQRNNTGCCLVTLSANSIHSTVNPQTLCDSCRAYTLFVSGMPLAYFKISFWRCLEIHWLFLNFCLSQQPEAACLSAPAICLWFT